MEHVVFYPALDGSPAFRRFASLDEAVRFVEHLRNAEGVAEVSVHALSPVPLAFRAYYKVEVPAEAPRDAGQPVDVPAPSEPVFDMPAFDAGAVEAPAAEVAAVPEMAPMPVAEEPAMADALVAAPAPSPNGKRSLGFFAH